jgi:hypothetical protein
MHIREKSKRFSLLKHEKTFDEYKNEATSDPEIDRRFTCGMTLDPILIWMQHWVFHKGRLT